jgi:hypothetical protein
MVYYLMFVVDPGNVIYALRGISMNKEELKSPFILLCSFLITVSFSSGADFRNNDWGDTPAEVMQYEGEGFASMTSGSSSNYKMFTESLGYDAMHLGINSGVIFIFTPEEQLGMGCCGSYDTEVKPFYLWEEALSDLYGKPENRDDLLTDEDSILDVYYRGDAAAVEAGIINEYFALVRYWETKNTYIWLVAEFYRDRLWVHVNYYSNEYFEFFREEKTQNGPRKGLRPWFDNDG